MTDYTEPYGIEGVVLVELFDKDGNLKDREEIHNLITTVGDQYYAERGANKAVPTQAAVTGMKLGTDSATAASKSGAGAKIVTYLAGSRVAFDSGYPQANAVAGTDTGWTVDYQCTWGAGVATSASLNEVAISNSATDAVGTAAEYISRAIFASTKNKTASDTLVVTWKHKMLGS